MNPTQDPIKGRGAQINTANPFLKHQIEKEVWDGIDEPLEEGKQTSFIYEHAKKIINKVTSPDLPMDYSLNPYQGCEHGCVYCYARNAHHYWGYSAGLDFEQKIIVKKNAPELLKKELLASSWKPAPISLSGNTDCYQPIERKLEITRQCLEVLWELKNPVGIITKNQLILRDIDLLGDMAQLHLAKVFVSITTGDKHLRQMMEPRTASTEQRWKVVSKLAQHGIPVGVMIGPVIPGLNNHEIPELVKQSKEAGAFWVGYSLVRLNGAVKELFEDWIRKAFPDRAEKVLNQIKSCHGGKLNNSEFGTRMRGTGELASSISQLFHLSRDKYFEGKSMPAYNTQAFRRPTDGQLRLF